MARDLVPEREVWQDSTTVAVWSIPVGRTSPLSALRPVRSGKALLLLIVVVSSLLIRRLTGVGVFSSFAWPRIRRFLPIHHAPSLPSLVIRTPVHHHGFLCMLRVFFHVVDTSRPSTVTITVTVTATVTFTSPTFVHAVLSKWGPVTLPDLSLDSVPVHFAGVDPVAVLINVVEDLVILFVVPVVCSGALLSLQLSILLIFFFLFVSLLASSSPRALSVGVGQPGWTCLLTTLLLVVRPGIEIHGTRERERGREGGEGERWGEVWCA